MARAQCIVHRQRKVLMVKHQQGDMEWWCLPGGGIEPGESPAQAALRELEEECGVRGEVIRHTSVLYYVDEDIHYSYYVEIGDQEPRLGHDPGAEAKTYHLADVAWMELREIPERDRAFLWAAGLMGIPEIFAELEQWSNDTSYPQCWETAS
jgi:ADP-ribose pyrophosphatase YjhB (NUDIX family)